MFAKIDIRKSALTLLAAAALSLAGGFASSVHASLASTSHLAASAISDATTAGAGEGAGRSAHRLTRPSNRIQGFAGEPGGVATANQAR
jgi:hypothetical protein